jgi:hypothetical protein
VGDARGKITECYAPLSRAKDSGVADATQFIS